MATLRLLCSTNPEHRDELVRTTGKAGLGVVVAEDLTCPNCAAVVGYPISTDDPDRAFIKGEFQQLMAKAGGCPCCKPQSAFEYQV